MVAPCVIAMSRCICISHGCGLPSIGGDQPGVACSRELQRHGAHSVRSLTHILSPLPCADILQCRLSLCNIPSDMLDQAYAVAADPTKPLDATPANITRMLLGALQVWLHASRPDEPCAAVRALRILAVRPLAAHHALTFLARLGRFLGAGPISTRPANAVCEAITLSVTARTSTSSEISSSV